MEVKEVAVLAEDVRAMIFQKHLFANPVVFVKQYIPSDGWRTRLLTTDQHRVSICKVFVVLLYGNVVDVRVEPCVTVGLANAVCTQLFPLQMAIKTACGNVLIETETVAEMDMLKTLVVDAARALMTTTVWLGTVPQQEDADVVVVPPPPPAK